MLASFVIEMMYADYKYCDLLFLHYISLLFLVCSMGILDYIATLYLYLPCSPLEGYRLTCIFLNPNEPVLVSEVCVGAYSSWDSSLRLCNICSRLTNMTIGMAEGASLSTWSRVWCSCHCTWPPVLQDIVSSMQKGASGCVDPKYFELVIFFNVCLLTLDSTWSSYHKFGFLGTDLHPKPCR